MDSDGYPFSELYLPKELILAEHDAQDRAGGRCTALCERHSEVLIMDATKSHTSRFKSLLSSTVDVACAFPYSRLVSMMCF